MNPQLFFDFAVNKEKHSVHVTREFAGELELIWDAWTKAELLDQWWAPAPYKTKTKKMDFRAGGIWLYAMVAPSGEENWGREDYTAVELHRRFSALDGFCNAEGELTAGFPRASWTNTFDGDGERTTVRIDIQYENLADLEKVISFGFKEGLTATLDNLDRFLETGFKLRKENKLKNVGRVTTYLNFPGTTEEAFLFYRSVFKSEFVGKGIQRFGDIPAEAGQPPVPEPMKKLILHVELPITGGHILMATDAPKEMGFTLTQGNNMHICVEPETREEARRIFDALGEGGKVTMPLQDMFFGSYFGELTDRYGINWMINHQNQ